MKYSYEERPTDGKCSLESILAFPFPIISHLPAIHGSLSRIPTKVQQTNVDAGKMSCMPALPPPVQPLEAWQLWWPVSS